MRVVVLSGLVLLGGCASMVGSYQINDESVISQAQLASAVSYCGLQGKISKDAVSEFEQAMERLHSVSTYNKDLYAQAYRDGQEKFKDLTTEEQVKSCSEGASMLPLGITHLNTLYTNIIQARSVEMNSIGQSIAAFGNSINQNAPRPVPYTYTPPQTQGFTPQSDDTKHYLIQTDQGNKLCAVTPSGYVNCN